MSRQPRTALASSLILCLLIPAAPSHAANILGLRFDGGSGAELLESINQTTASIATAVTLPAFGSVSGAGASVNPATGNYSFVGSYSAEAFDRLFTLNPATGVVVSEPMASLSNISNLKYDGAGNLLGLRFNAGAGSEELVSINPATAAITLLGSIPSFSSVISNAAYDPLGDNYSFIGSLSATPATPQLFSLDATSGTLTSQPTIAPPSSLSHLHYNGSGQILGLRFDAGTTSELLVSIDPSTGGISTVATLPNFGSVSGSPGYDFSTDIFSFTGTRSTEAFERLFSLDAASGTLVYEPAYSPPNTINLLVYGIPEPAAPVLLGSGLGMLLFVRRRRPPSRCSAMHWDV